MGKKRRYQRRKNNDINLILIGIGAVALISLAFGLRSGEIKNIGLFIVLITALAMVIVILFFSIRSVMKHISLKIENDRYYGYIGRIHELRMMDPIEFESYVGWLFEQQGYSYKITQQGGDHGIDVLLEKGGERFAVQVKRYKKGKSVGEPELRDFYGSFHSQGISSGFFVTTSNFSEAAKKWAEKQPISLIDEKSLIEMLHKHKKNS